MYPPCESATMRQPRFKCLLGTTPGQLDPTQPERVLRGSGCKLSFAILDDGKMVTAPSTEADGMHRIVIEEPPKGAGAHLRCRVVPNADLAPGVENEGKSWPRTVNICGEIVVCSREQWYIYKLDPGYDCYVPNPPNPPVISRREPEPRNENGKREFSGTSADVEYISKRFRTALSFREEEGGTSKATPDNSPSHPSPHPQESATPDVVDVMDVTPDDASGSSHSSASASPLTYDAVAHEHVPSCPSETDTRTTGNHVPVSPPSGAGRGSPHSAQGPPFINAQGDSSAGPAAEAPYATVAGWDSAQPHNGHVPAEGGIYDVPPPYSRDTMRGPFDMETDTCEGSAAGWGEAPARAPTDRVEGELGSTSRPDTLTTPQSRADPSPTPQSPPAPRSPTPPTQPPEVVDLTMDVDEETSPSPQQYRTKRRKANEDGGPAPEDDRSPKRVRVDPVQTQQSEARREERRAADRKARRRTDRLAAQVLRKQVAEEDRRRREEKFWEDVLTPEAQPGEPTCSGSSANMLRSSTSASSTATPNTSTSRGTAETGADHMAEIEASRRKLAELDKDRPLWAKEEVKRKVAEKAEEAEHQAAKAAKAAKTAKKEEARKSQQAGKEDVQQDVPVAASREEQLQKQAKQARARLQTRYSRRTWSSVTAIQYYAQAGSTFDTTTFTAQNPALFEIIPWPTLFPPWEVDVTHVDWHHVETFFQEARAQLTLKAYKELLEKTHKRYHPDRWRSRGLLKTIGVEELVSQLAATGNVVSQAVTPIWKAAREL